MRNEMRQNLMTGQWVIYAPDRGERPSDFEESPPQNQRGLPQHDADCPFCPGHEDRLTEIVLQLGRAEGHSWQTRVVPNKFPMLQPDKDQVRRRDGLYVNMPGYGHHEVIIEHPRHDLDIPYMDEDEVATIVETYHRRYVDLMQQNSNMMAIIFRNHGEAAGTSILHPHSQMVVTGVVPRHVRWREDIAQIYYDTWGRPLMHEMLDHELQEGTRIVEAGEHFITLVPYAAEVPYEMWVVPRRQQADFGAITDAEKADLAPMLQRALKRLCRSSNNPDYNYVIHTSPRYEADEPYLHWYIQIRPRLVTRAGFEIGSGMLVNPSLPEEDAQQLRSVELQAISGGD